MDVQPIVEERMGSVSLLFLLLLPPAAAAGFSRSANASLAFSVCSTNKPSSKRRADPHIPLRTAARCAFLLLRLFFPPLHFSGPLALLRSSIEAPFDRFLETKTSVKTTKEVSFTVVTALLDIASIVLICCVSRVDRLGRALFRVCRINITPRVGARGFFHAADK